MEMMEEDLFKVGASKSCVFESCKTDSRRSAIPFISFPKPCLAVRKNSVIGDKKHIKDCPLCNKCELWLHKCNRSDGKFSDLHHIKRWHYICTLHFVDKTGPTEAYPYPLPSSEVLNKRKLQEKVPSSQHLSLCNLKSRKRKSTEFIAEVNAQKCQVSASTSTDFDVCDALAMKKAETSSQTMEIVFENSTGLTNDIVDKSTEPLLRCHKNVSTQTTFIWKPVSLIMNENNRLKKELKIMKMENIRFKQSIKKQTSNGNSSENITNFVSSLKKDSKKCKFYTNLTFNNIIALLTFLSPVENLHYWGTKKTSNSPKKRKLSNLEELCVMLIRLRTGLLVEDMKYRFNISTSLLSKIVITWVQLCYMKFNVIRPLMFSTRELIKNKLPSIFKSLKNIRIIIDCAEFFCQSPSNFEQQGNLYSSYKATTTFKVLLGCTPNGAISFVSDIFEGSISDKKLVEESKLMDWLDEGDLVLADRGFTISDLTNKKNVSLNIPPFLKGRDTLTAEEEIETKNIAKQRIYIEHVVGKVKKFRLLKKILPLNMRGILSQIVFVCACLTNFQEPIIK